MPTAGFAVYEKFNNKDKSYFISSAVFAVAFALIYLGCYAHAMHEKYCTSSAGPFKLDSATEDPLELSLTRVHSKLDNIESSSLALLEDLDADADNGIAAP